MVLKEKIEEYDEFIKNHERGHFLQSREWANVKKSWKNEIVIIRDENNEIKGTMSILIRKIPFLGCSIMYCPRGPVYDIKNTQIGKEIMGKVKKLAKKYKTCIFEMDPDIEITNEEYKKSLEEIGFKFQKHKKNEYIKTGMQPKSVFRLNLKDKKEEDIFKFFSSKTRYNIRLAQKKGVIIRKGEKKDLKKLYSIFIETGKRDGFFIRSYEYFENLYDSMQKYSQIYLAEYEGQVIAGILVIYYARKAWYLYGGSSNCSRNVMPNYLLQWEAIKEAIQKKCCYYDFRGVLGCKGDENAPGYGLYKFKKGFNSNFLEFIDEPYIVYRPVMNILYNTAEKIYSGTLAKLFLKKINTLK